MKKYNLTIGNVYTSYGEIEINGYTRFLILNDDGIPSFYPKPLFEIIDDCFPLDWNTVFFSGINCNIKVRSGFVDSYRVIVDLITENNIMIGQFRQYIYNNSFFYDE